jgi:hypothetical protein
MSEEPRDCDSRSISNAKTPAFGLCDLDVLPLDWGAELPYRYEIRWSRSCLQHLFIRIFVLFMCRYRYFMYKYMYVCLVIYYIHIERDTESEDRGMSFHSVAVCEPPLKGIFCACKTSMFV